MKGVLLKVGLILLLAVTTDALNAQTFVLKPAELQGSDGGFSVKLLIKRDKVFRLTWLNPDESALNLNGANAKLLIGRTPNDYDVLSENISGTNAQFIADNLGLTPGGTTRELQIRRIVRLQRFRLTSKMIPTALFIRTKYSC